MTQKLMAKRDLLERSEALVMLVSRALAIFGAFALLALLAITVTEVTARYIFNAPVFGVEDISSMALTVIVAGSVAYGAHFNAHVSVNVVKYVGGRGLTRWSDLLVRALGTMALFIAAYALFHKGLCGRPCGAATNNLSITHTPFYMMLSAAMTAYALLLVIHLLVGLRHWSGHDPNEVPE